MGSTTTIDILRRRILAPAASSLALALAAQVAAAPAVSPVPVAVKATGDALEWVPSYEEALVRAKKEKKLVLLDFYTDWCGWCKRLDADVFSQVSFQNAASGVLGVKVNAEKLPDLRQRFQVSSYPRLFFVTPDGMTVERIHGYLNLQEFTAKVQAVKRGDTEFARYRDAAADTKNYGAVQTFAQWLTEGGQHEQAIPYWQALHDSALEMIFQNSNQAGAMVMHRKALYQLGEGYRTVGLPDVAVQQYEEVLRTYPESQEALQAINGLVAVRAQSASVRLPVPVLEQLIRQQPGTPIAGQAQMLLQQIRTSGAGQ